MTYSLKKILLISRLSNAKKVDHGTSISGEISTNYYKICYEYIDRHFSTDTFFITPRKGSRGKPKIGNICMQVFVSDKVSPTVVMSPKDEFPNALKLSCKKMCVLTIIVVDLCKEETSGQVQKFYHQVSATLHIFRTV